jgi:hypothetical protein
MVHIDPFWQGPKEAQVAVRSRRDLRMPGGMFRQNRITGRLDKPSQAFGGASRHKNRGATVNAISLFGSATTPAAWVEIFLGLSALTMFSTLPDWQSTSRASRTAPAWLPVGGLLGLAVASVITGVMQPELFAAAFGQI